jgi:hypothetical protein
MARRITAISAIGAMLFAGSAFNLRGSTSKPMADAALRAAEAAGCGDVQSPEGSSPPGGQHLGAGEQYSYAAKPATGGAHDPAPLPAAQHIYSSPVPETQAVHNLEHAYVLIYYRRGGIDRLPTSVIRSLSEVAKQENKVIMAPHPELPSSTSLALVAWNKLWSCPSTVTPRQAQILASGFIEAYRGTSNAPEATAP